MSLTSLECSTRSPSARKNNMDRLSCATTFQILPEFYPAYGIIAGGITISRREQRGGAYKWVVMLRDIYVLSRSGNWLYERQPSSRTNAYLSKTRFDTLDDAWITAEKAANSIKREILKKYGDKPMVDFHNNPFTLDKWTP